VVETSIGVDRMFLQVISASYFEEELESNGQKDIRVVLKIPPVLAPVKLAVMPLVKKDGLPEISQKIIDELKFDFNCQYDEKDSIGKRYRRQDAIGTPFCVTVDNQTPLDQTVTIRYRDTMEQERVTISEIGKIIGEQISYKKLFNKLQ
jgi:glycyl-tRNA synthetase